LNKPQSRFARASRALRAIVTCGVSLATTGYRALETETTVW